MKQCGTEIKCRQAMGTKESNWSGLYLTVLAFMNVYYRH